MPSVSQDPDSVLTRMCDILFDKRYEVRDRSDGSSWHVLHAEHVFVVTATSIRNIRTDSNFWFWADLSFSTVRGRHVRVHACKLPFTPSDASGAPPIVVLTSILDRCVATAPIDAMTETVYNRVIMDLFMRGTSAHKKATLISKWFHTLPFEESGTRYSYFQCTPEPNKTYALIMSALQHSERFMHIVKVRSAFGGWEFSIAVDHNGVYHYIGNSIYYMRVPVRLQEPPFKFVDRLIGLCEPQLYDLAGRTSNGMPFSLVLAFRSTDPRAGLYAKRVKYDPVRTDFVQLVQNAGASGDLPEEYSDNEAAMADLRRRLALMQTHLEAHPTSRYAYWLPDIRAAAEEAGPSNLADRLFRTDMHNTYRIEGRAAGTGPATRAHALRSLARGAPTATDQRYRRPHSRESAMHGDKSVLGIVDGAFVKLLGSDGGLRIQLDSTPMRLLDQRVSSRARAYELAVAHNAPSAISTIFSTRDPVFVEIARVPQSTRVRLSISCHDATAPAILVLEYDKALPIPLG